MSVAFTPRVAIFWIAAIMCIVAEIAILRSMLRGSRANHAGSSDADAVVPRGRPAVELIWAILPALGLILVLALTRGAVR
jgi:hypothetical protein